MDRIIANELSPESLASINNIIQEYNLDHNTDFKAVMRDWGLSSTDADADADCETMPSKLQEDSLESLRSLLHFVSESTIYRDLTTASSGSKENNLVPLVTMQNYVSLLEHISKKALKDLQEEMTQPGSKDALSKARAYVTMVDASGLWEPPSLLAAKAKRKAEGLIWNKLTLTFHRVRVAREMMLVFNNAIRAKEKGGAM